MKIKTKMIITGIIAVVCILSTLNTGMLLQQADSKDCNIFFGNGTSKQTGSACDSEPDYGTVNIHFK